MIRKLNFKFFIILHWYSRNSKICIRVLYMKQTWNTLSKLSIWMKLCDFTNSNWWIKLSGIRWRLKWWFLVFPNFDLITFWFLRLQDIFFNFQRIFAWTFHIVNCGNLCLAIERICYFMHLFPLLLFIFQTIPLCDCSIK